MMSKVQFLEKKGSKTGILLSEFYALILAFLFAYTAIAKVYDWQATQLAIFNQVVPYWSKNLLLFGIPIVELGIAGMLLIPVWRRVGFLASFILMSAFTGYVAWVWLGIAGRIPCSCGGVISSLSWGQHLIFNLVFLTISLVGWKTYAKEIKPKPPLGDQKPDSA